MVQGFGQALIAYVFVVARPAFAKSKRPPRVIGNQGVAFGAANINAKKVIGYSSTSICFRCIKAVGGYLLALPLCHSAQKMSKGAR